MPLSHAWLRCPDGFFLDGAFDSYFAASLRVDTILRRATPDIERLSIEDVVVGLPTSVPRREAAEIAIRIQRDITELGFDAACGLARSKLVARVASQIGKPRGIVHGLDGYEARFLSPLKIEMLPGIDPAITRRLRAAGIRRLGQITKLTEPQLSMLACRTGPALARQAAGLDASRI